MKLLLQAFMVALAAWSHLVRAHRPQEKRQVARIAGKFSSHLLRILHTKMPLVAFFVELISGSRFSSRFFVEGGAAISVALTRCLGEVVAPYQPAAR